MRYADGSHLPLSLSERPDDHQKRSLSLSCILFTRLYKLYILSQRSVCGTSTHANTCHAGHHRHLMHVEYVYIRSCAISSHIVILSKTSTNTPTTIMINDHRYSIYACPAHTCSRICLVTYVLTK